MTFPATAGLKEDGTFLYEGYEIDVRILDTCLDGKPAHPIKNPPHELLRACSGSAMGECMDANDLSGKGLYDNRTMIGCAYAEQTYWQRRMHQGYEALFVWAGERTHDPKDRYSSLTDMRAKWIDFVDAKCLSLGSVNYGGRESSIHHAGCKLTEVARHALELESRINSYCEIQSTAAFEEACKQRNLARP